VLNGGEQHGGCTDLYTAEWRKYMRRPIRTDILKSRDVPGSGFMNVIAADNKIL
jgi:hypothetical protein